MRSICNLKYSVPKIIPIASDNGSNNDYHFIIKELVEEFKKLFTCLGENTEKYITFTVPIEKEVTRIDKNGEEVTKIYLLHITIYGQTAQLMIAQDLWQVPYQILSIILLNKFRELNASIYVNDDKNCETCGIKYKRCNCFLDYKNFKDDLIEYKCLCCNKNHQYKFDEKLKKRFFNTCKLSHHEIDKFILLLQKDICPYE